MARKSLELEQKTAEVRRAVKQTEEANVARQRTSSELLVLRDEYRKEAALSRMLAAKAPAAVQALPAEHRAQPMKAPLVAPSPWVGRQRILQVTSPPVARQYTVCPWCGDSTRRGDLGA